MTGPDLKQNDKPQADQGTMNSAGGTESEDLSIRMKELSVEAKATEPTKPVEATKATEPTKSTEMPKLTPAEYLIQDQIDGHRANLNNPKASTASKCQSRLAIEFLSGNRNMDIKQWKKEHSDRAREAEQVWEDICELSRIEARFRARMERKEEENL